MTCKSLRALRITDDDLLPQTELTTSAFVGPLGIWFILSHFSVNRDHNSLEKIPTEPS